MCSLGGVPNGSPFEQFDWLGPAEGRWKYRDGTRQFAWFSKGLEFYVEGDSFCFAMLSFQPPGTDRHQPFPGVFILKGRRFRIQPASTEADVVALMGDPAKRILDENVIETLYFRIGQYDCLFDFVDDGELAEMHVSSPREDACG
jgi:hypothetical protein